MECHHYQEKKKHPHMHRGHTSSWQTFHLYYQQVAEYEEVDKPVLLFHDSFIFGLLENIPIHPFMIHPALQYSSFLQNDPVYGEKKTP